MRYLSSIILTSLVLFSTTEARPRTGPQYDFSTGIAIPESPERFGRVWHTGFALSIGVALPVDDGIQLVTNLDYHRMALNNSKLLQEAGLTGSDAIVKGGETTLLSAFLGAKIRLIPSHLDVNPYLLAGVGVHRFSVADATVSQQDQSENLNGSQETAIGLGLGAGIDFVLSEGVSLFVEGRYNTCYTETNNTQYLPVRIGLSLR